MATSSPSFPSAPPTAPSASAVHAKLSKSPGKIGSAIFLGACPSGLSMRPTIWYRISRPFTRRRSSRLYC